MKNKLFNINKPIFKLKCIICGKEMIPKMNIFTCSKSKCKEKLRKFTNKLKRKLNYKNYYKKHKGYRRWRYKMLKKYKVKHLTTIDEEIFNLETQIRKESIKNGNV